MFLDFDRWPPEDLALLDAHGTSITYGDLAALPSTLSPYVSPRSLVFVLGGNQTGLVSLFLSLFSLDCVPLLLSPTIDEGLLQTLIKTYRPCRILATDKAVEALCYPVLWRGWGCALLDTGFKSPPLFKELAFLLSTSGSTGSAKLVRFGKGTLEINAQNVREAFGWPKMERGIVSLPIHYVMGLNVLLSHLVCGACVLLTEQNLMEQGFWDFVKKERGTNFTGVPFSFELLLRLHIERMELPHLTCFAQGGGKMKERHFKSFAALAQKKGWRFIATYGTTETAARCSLLPPEEALTAPGSIGRAIPGVHLSLQDEKGTLILEPHRQGELIVTGRNVTLGYARCAEDLMRGDDFQGTYATGDLALRDEDGRYFILGRKSRFIKMLGNRIGLDECQELLSQRLGVPAVCIGKDDCLLILTTKDPECDIALCLSQWLNLHRSLFQAKVIPEFERTAFGKIRYGELEKRYLF
ncbi:hypothetical protein ABB02_00703 [Clostridiaceae bacterium JG1575]|nr:hypothetical protein ABB02_00703 [Clostridiaceae bacterium JG1575]